MRGWVAAAILVLLSACARHPETPLFTGEPYLLVWAGDADRQSSDFLAVLDADPTSPSYGKVLRTYPVASRGNEPQALLGAPRADRRVFASGVLTNRTFVFDVRQPLAARLVHIDEPRAGRRFGAPHDYVTLPNGHVLGTCTDALRYRGEPREILGAPGGLVELDADGGFVREIPAADPAARHLIIAPFGAAASPSLGRLVTTNAGHGYAATTRSERMPGISVQVWELDGLRLQKTAILDADKRGEENLGPIMARFLQRKSVLYVGTDQGSALYASDSIGSPSPVFQLAFDFGPGALGGGTAITPDDRFLVEALGGSSRVASLDLADPWHPKLVSAVRLDRDPLDTAKARPGGPHGLAMSADGTRIAVADYTVDVPGYRHDGDHRVYMLRLASATPGSIRAGRWRPSGRSRSIPPRRAAASGGASSSGRSRSPARACRRCGSCRRASTPCRSASTCARDSTSWRPSSSSSSALARRSSRRAPRRAPPCVPRRPRTRRVSSPATRAPSARRARRASTSTCAADAYWWRRTGARSPATRWESASRAWPTWAPRRPTMRRSCSASPARSRASSPRRATACARWCRPPIAAWSRGSWASASASSAPATTWCAAGARRRRPTTCS